MSVWFIPLVSTVSRCGAPACSVDASFAALTFGPRPPVSSAPTQTHRAADSQGGAQELPGLWPYCVLDPSCSAASSFSGWAAAGPWALHTQTAIADSRPWILWAHRWLSSYNGTRIPYWFCLSNWYIWITQITTQQRAAGRPPSACRDLG